MVGPDRQLIASLEVEADVRPGGYLRWSEVFPAEPSIWTHGRIDLTDVVDGELLDGVMTITGQLPGGYEPFETRMRVEFHDEADGRTRLESASGSPRTMSRRARGVGSKRSANWTRCSTREASPGLRVRRK